MHITLTTVVVADDVSLLDVPVAWQLVDVRVVKLIKHTILKACEGKPASKVFTTIRSWRQAGAKAALLEG